MTFKLVSLLVHKYGVVSDSLPSMVVDVIVSTTDDCSIECKNTGLDLEVLRPLTQLGDIFNERLMDMFELPRGNWGEGVEEASWLEKLGGVKMRMEFLG